MSEPFMLECLVPECEATFVDESGNPMPVLIDQRQHMKLEHWSWHLKQREAAGELAPEIGPALYSYWLHSDVVDLSPFGTTIIRIEGWSRYSGDGSVEVTYFSVNGASNNTDLRNHTIPEEIRSISIHAFWEMVAFGNLTYLPKMEGMFMAEGGVFGVGDKLQSG